MSADIELLRLAAKAAGFDVDFDAQCLGKYGFEKTRFGSVKAWWNALTDDGDALRLAVELGLRMNASARIGSGWAGCAVGDGAGRLGEVKMSGDSYADMRRAIVLAAAEIGRAMP